MWTLWLPLVAGFGVWQASNLAYLRTMVSIHIMHGVPVSFVFLLLALLVCRSPKTTLNGVFPRFLYEPCVPTEYSSELLGIPIENR